MNFADAWLNELEDSVPDQPLTTGKRLDFSESAIENYPRLIGNIRKLRKENSDLREERGTVKCDCGLGQAKVVCGNCHDIMPIGEEGSKSGVVSRAWGARHRALDLLIITALLFGSPVVLLFGLSLAGINLPPTMSTYAFAFFLTTFFNPNSPIKRA
jgi:hypothetical protein